MLEFAGLGIALAALAAAGGVELGRRRKEGRVRAVPVADESGAQLLARLGVTPGTPVTLLQFSSAFCAPCRAARVLCRQIATEWPRVRHVEVDAESHLAEVRALGVWRTPTVFLVDRLGRIVGRITGVPRRDQLLAAIRPLLTEGEPG